MNSGSGSGVSETDLAANHPLQAPSSSPVQRATFSSRLEPELSPSEKILGESKFESKAKLYAKLSHVEAHEKRMKALRKEVDFLNNTAWQFEKDNKFL